MRTPRTLPPRTPARSAAPTTLRSVNNVIRDPFMRNVFPTLILAPPVPALPPTVHSPPGFVSTARPRWPDIFAPSTLRSTAKNSPPWRAAPCGGRYTPLRRCAPVATSGSPTAHESPGRYCGAPAVRGAGGQAAHSSPPFLCLGKQRQSRQLVPPRLCPPPRRHPQRQRPRVHIEDLRPHGERAVSVTEEGLGRGTAGVGCAVLQIGD